MGGAGEEGAAPEDVTAAATAAGAEAGVSSVLLSCRYKYRGSLRGVTRGCSFVHLFIEAARLRRKGRTEECIGSVRHQE